MSVNKYSEEPHTKQPCPFQSSDLFFGERNCIVFQGQKHHALEDMTTIFCRKKFLFLGCERSAAFGKHMIHIYVLNERRKGDPWREILQLTGQKWLSTFWWYKISFWPLEKKRRKKYAELFPRPFPGLFWNLGFLKGPKKGLKGCIKQICKHSLQL